MKIVRFLFLVLPLLVTLHVSAQDGKKMEKLLFPSEDRVPVENALPAEALLLFKAKIKAALDNHLYFHGTLSEYVASILKGGLAPHFKVGATKDVSLDVCVQDHVFLTKSFGEAYFFSNWAFLNKEIRENMVLKLPGTKSRGFVAAFTSFTDVQGLDPANLSVDGQTKSDVAFKYKGQLPKEVIFNPFASIFDAKNGLTKVERGLRLASGITSDQLASELFLTIAGDLLKEKIFAYLGRLKLERSEWIDPHHTL